MSSAQVYSFNPTLSNPIFTPVGENQTLYAPTGLALGEGGLWATEHSASAMAFLNFTTGAWTIFPTSTVPYTPWVLTYFDGVERDGGLVQRALWQPDGRDIRQRHPADGVQRLEPARSTTSPPSPTRPTASTW